MGACNGEYVVGRAGRCFGGPEGVRRRGERSVGAAASLARGQG